ncbi:2-oxoglutarate dehydrogenase E1 component [Gynuella sunshinyii]|uniref:2-oxoglutarate dehydrogenase E1 component n=1 Tax=Gynuella sunshinyii YC6258 TaxID=1445510 RepID=A0A0C5V7H5_9GAMM|nr:2-oxoglutarate dehydrogenase E1 component [Gynuella sunshinyii]AJQ95370.1 2-oxoglutarate dehydrogenase complex, dehydrogenase (E1) component-related enzyme [Gynuella sunshinyii YC6258]
MQDSIMEQLWGTSHLAGGNSSYLEELYESYLRDPNSVPEDWRAEFDKLPRVNPSVHSEVPHSPIKDHFLLLSKNQKKLSTAVLSPSITTEHERKQVRVHQLATAYRFRGHQKAKLDPLGLEQRPSIPDLELQYHELSKADEDTVFSCSHLYAGKEEATLKETIELLEQTYCSSVGAEFTHIVDTAERRWIEQRMESVKSHPVYSNEARLHILERLSAGEGLEKYLQSKYPGTKRFGLEGGEALIPLVDELIQRAGSYGTKEIVLGMAHRGRLNILVNILGKSPRDLFDEFEGKSFYEMGSGDVKYHQGFSSNVMTQGGEVHLAMAFNPSHLEIVSPVVEGSVRARQDRRKDPVGTTVLPVAIHGDAAFAGQGVVMETFQMSQTRGYKTGGTIHIIVNNQVGFTTSRREDARSTEYCTDIAKMVQAPIFHVNGDDPEAVVFVTQLAVDYRQQFKRDVVIDMVCYRRRGHNEADEPAMTQPLMYEKIRKIKSTLDLYGERLVNEGVIDKDGVTQMAEEYRTALENGEHVAKSLVKEPNTSLFVDWKPYLNQPFSDDFDTSLDLQYLRELANRINTVPEGFPVQRQVNKIIEDRLKMAAGAMPINWGFAETLAYATILDSDHPIRITGQDVGRGTFVHRHAVLHSTKDGSTYVPLRNLSEDQPEFDIYDSFLSEEAVLAFEYGYATTTPNALVIWEAQFGDFANGAQVVIDQFITSGEHKWGRLCGLVMLLPHGYEGQGPEHSSARLERYLQLCAEQNIQVCVPSTPAQVYHMLRRQITRNLRKPLVVMSPKSLLRHKDAVSTLDELATGKFETVLDDPDITDKDAVQRVVFCSGKVYYDLRERCRRDEIVNVALVRVEQLYPFPEDRLYQILSTYPKVEDVVWCQEEPMNQGAWYSSQHHLRNVIHRHDPDLYLVYVGREASAAPAAGYMKLHLEQLNKFLEDALVYPKK